MYRGNLSNHYVPVDKSTSIFFSRTLVFQHLFASSSRVVRKRKHGNFSHIRDSAFQPNAKTPEAGVVSEALTICCSKREKKVANDMYGLMFLSGANSRCRLWLTVLVFQASAPINKLLARFHLEVIRNRVSDVEKRPRNNFVCRYSTVHISLWNKQTTHIAS